MSASYDQVIALIIALAGGEPDGDHFRTLLDGGADPAFPVALAPCPKPLDRSEIEGRTIVCGTVRVPEDHANPGAATIDLVFTVMRSHSSYPEPDPVVHLHGGPGVGAVEGISLFARLFDAWRQTRDIVIFDQRAAGLSGQSTTCYEALTLNVVEIAKGKATVTEAEGDEARPSKLIAACVRELQSAGIGLEHYNTHQNALDVRSVVRTLGYETYNIYGISYGTKLALEVMRSAPEGVRSVIIDGVAPPSVRLYDTLAVPQNEAMVTLVAECAADAACDGAYPELGAKLHEAYANAAAGKVKVNGQAIPAGIVSALFERRNGSYRYASYTRYLPAAIAEMARGEAAPTLEMLLEKQLIFPKQGTDEARKSAATLTDEQKRIVNTALAEAEAIRASESALDMTVADLKETLQRDRELGPLAALFDQEMSKASGPLQANPELARAAVVDYAAMQNAVPSKHLLNLFVSKYFEEPARQRLQALIAAMSESEVKGAFDAIRAAAAKIEHDVIGGAHLWVYACQEDRPYNTLDGYRKLTAGLEYSEILRKWDTAAQDFYTVCDLFDAHPRAGYHDPVVSDIPTLSIGSTWDTQTAASWANVAAETLSRSQSFIIPEAGHGALAYQPCVIDMGVAFINDPSRRLDDNCALSARPDFYIAPWVKDAKP